VAVQLGVDRFGHCRYGLILLLKIIALSFGMGDALVQARTITALSGREAAARMNSGDFFGAHLRIKRLFIEVHLKPRLQER